MVVSSGKWKRLLKFKNTCLVKKVIMSCCRNKYGFIVSRQLIFGVLNFFEVKYFIYFNPSDRIFIHAFDFHHNVDVINKNENWRAKKSQGWNALWLNWMQQNLKHSLSTSIRLKQFLWSSMRIFSKSFS